MSWPLLSVHTRYLSILHMHCRRLLLLLRLVRPDQREDLDRRRPVSPDGLEQLQT